MATFGKFSNKAYKRLIGEAPPENRIQALMLSNPQTVVIHVHLGLCQPCAGAALPSGPAQCPVAEQSCPPANFQISGHLIRQNERASFKTFKEETYPHKQFARAALW